MCRLFACVHAGSALTLRGALGDQVLDEFLALAQVHRDGWGAAWRQGDGLSSYLSSRSAVDDGALFRALADQALDSVVIHQRWASPGIARRHENQQPFVAEGLAFAHNGTIENAEGNLVLRSGSPATQSDSRLYAELFWGHLGTHRGEAEVRRALARTVAQLRQDYPQASYNALVQTPDFTLALQAHADHPMISEKAQKRYAEVGWTHRLANYSDLVYTTLSHPGSTTSLVTSSGYAAADGWTTLGNNTLVVLSHQDASARTWSLAESLG